MTDITTVLSLRLVAVLAWCRERLGPFVAEAMMVYDEAIHPDVHVSYVDRQAQDERPLLRRHRIGPCPNPSRNANPWAN